MKRLLILFVVLAMLLCSAGCQQADSTKVPVQSISMILGYSPLALVDRFSGIIVVSNEVKIEKDSSNTIAECFVNEGDRVEAGQMLFSYDLDAMKLELEKAK